MRRALRGEGDYKITQEQERRLTALGARLCRNFVRGEEMFQKTITELQDFKSEHGHLEVPDSTKLGARLTRIRMDIRRGKTIAGGNTLSPEQVLCLRDMGVRLELRNGRGGEWFEKRFQELVEFKLAHGGNLPNGADKALRHWVYIRSQMIRGNIECTMTEEQKSRLVQAGVGVTKDKSQGSEVHPWA